MSKPGKSDRTPFKRQVLNSVVGRCVGAYSTGKLRFLGNDCIFVDLCAGDGAEIDSSPQVFLKHANTLLNPKRDLARIGHPSVVLIERDEETYFSLLDNTGMVPNYVKRIRMDSFDYVIPPMRKGTWGFVYIDPNNAHKLPLTHKMCKSIPNYACIMITLGFNAGGIKMLPEKFRLQWYSPIELIKETLPTTQDILLIENEKDSNQWAYLIRQPVAWVEQNKHIFRRVANKKGHGYSIKITSLCFQGENYFDLRLDRLIRTQKEMEA